MRGVHVGRVDIDAPWLLEDTWAATLGRAAAMPAGTVDVSVDGEWSLAQTLRHLVMATDKWLGGVALGMEAPYHPIGQPNLEYESDGLDMSVFQTAKPPYSEVLEVRAGRVGMVRGFLAAVTDDELLNPCAAPDDPQRSITTLECLHVTCTRNTVDAGSEQPVTDAGSRASSPAAMIAEFTMRRRDSVTWPETSKAACTAHPA